VLRDATAAATALGELRPKLDRPLEKAIERVADARSRCQAGRTAGTRRRLKQAKKALGRYVRRLRGERARTTAPADVREPLAVEGDGIAGAVRTLRRAIACPADA
jgi:chorismate-pyruvate lyase